jgi:hypothetical protein
MRNHVHRQTLKGKNVSVSTSKLNSKLKSSAFGNFFNSLEENRKLVLYGTNRTAPLQAHSDDVLTAGTTQIWYRVGQLAAKYPAFTENAIRAQIFAAKPRLSAKTKNGKSWINGNGLAPAIRKCGRSVLINEPMYARWIETGSCGQGSKA